LKIGEAGGDTVGREESDERLMARFREGDAGAFEDLVRRHRTGVFSFLARLLGDRARAEDLAQETWMKAIAAAPRWEERARFRTWILSIARNLAADDARRRAFRGTPQPLDVAGRPGDPPPDRVLAVADPPPDRAASAALLRPRLEAAIADLPEEQREVFLLREYAGVPFAEIAAITGTPEPTVKSRMRYALETLRRRLEAMGVGASDAVPDPAGRWP
jgi:RNA polymerase sigma-70 factor (ECF subfamily)